MGNMTINLNSVVCPVCKGTTLTELGHLRTLAIKENVEIHFFNEWCRIIGAKSRKVKVPAKAVKDGQSMTAWIRNRIESAWK